MVRYRKKKSGATLAMQKKLKAMDDSYGIVGQELTEAVLMARSSHRFKARSGNLERAIQSDVVRDGDNIIGTLAIKDSIAAYGYWVSKGHGSWAPDPFLRRAKDRFFKVIDEKIKKLLGKKEK